MNYINEVENIRDNLLRIVYPSRCPICGNIIDYGKPLLVCEKCRGEIKYICEPCCKKCGKPLVVREQEYCYDCSRQEHEFTRGLSLWLYDKEVQKSIYNFKYNNKREYARIYINELTKYHREKIISWRAQCLIPVPVHKAKMRERGFNQAELLAKELGKQLELPVNDKLIIRCKETTPQKQLNSKERKNNLKKAFKISNNDVKLKKVILVDDIYTTGATIDSISAVLKNAGVSNVYFVSISIGEGL